MTRPALVALSMMAGLAGWTAGGAVGGTVRPWFVAVVAAAVVAETTAARSALETAAGDRGAMARRSWRRAELVVFVLGTKTLHVLTALPGAAEELARFPRGLVDPETATSLLVGLAVWMLANATLDDLAAIERGVDAGPGAVARVRSRIVGVSVVVVALGGFGLVGVDGVLDLDRPASTRTPAAAALFVVVAVLALSRIAHGASAGAWERDGAAVDPRLPGRWRRISIAAVVLAVLVGAGVPFLTRSLSAAPVVGITRAGGLGDWLVDVVERLRDTDGPSVSTDREPGRELQPELEPLPESSRPEWLGEVALWLLVGSVLAFVVVRAGRVRVRVRIPDGDRLPWGPVILEAIRVVGRGLAALWRTVWDLIRSTLRMARWGSGRVSPTSPGPMEARAAGHLPDDPARARIYVAFRRFTDAAGRVVGVRGAAETPREFSGRVASGPRSAIRIVTVLYETARYSDHPMGEHEADGAERAADRVTARLSEGTEGAGPGQE